MARRRYAKGAAGERRPPGDPDDEVPPGEVPVEVAERAKAAFQSRGGEGDLAALELDSLVDGDDTGRQYVLRFSHPRGWVQVNVTTAADSCTLRGRLEPHAWREAEIELEGRDVVVAVPVVVPGEFVLEDVPRGLTRLRIVGTGGVRPLRTDWFRT